MSDMRISFALERATPASHNGAILATTNGSRELHQSAVVSPSHCLAVNALAVFARHSATMLYTGGRDSSIREWAVEETHRPLRVLAHHTDWVADLAPLHGGSHPGHDGVVKLWDLDKGVVTQSYTYHSDYVRALSVASKTTTLVASGGLDGRVFVWDCLVDVQEGAQRTESDIRFAPLAQSFLCGSRADSVYSTSISGDGSTVAAGSSHGPVRIFDIETGLSKAVLREHADVVRALCLNERGDVIASASSDRTVRIVDLRTMKAIHTVTEHRESVTTLHVSADWTHVWSTARNGACIHTDLTAGKSRVLFNDDAPILASAMNSNCSAIWTSNEIGEIRCWKLKDSEGGATENDEENEETKLSFPPMSEATGEKELNNENKEIAERKTTHLAKKNGVVAGAMHVLEKPSPVIVSHSGILRAEILPSKRQVITQDGEGRIELWDVTRAQRLRTLAKSKDPDVFFEHVSQLSTKETVPRWFSVDLKSGELVIHLDTPSCFSANVGLMDSGLPGSLEAYPGKDEPTVNLGERMLASLFHEWHRGYTTAHEETLQELAASSTIPPSPGFHTPEPKKKSRWWTFGQGDDTPPPTPKSVRPDLKLLNRQKANTALPLFDVPPSTAVIISSVDPRTNFSRTLVRQNVGEFTGTELLPAWVYDALVLEEIPIDAQKRIQVVLTCGDERIASLSRSKLYDLPRLYRIGRICRWVMESYSLTRPLRQDGPETSDEPVSASEYIQIVCKDEVLEPPMTIAAVKQYCWKAPAPIALTYRINPDFV